MVAKNSCPYVYGGTSLIRSFNHCMGISTSPTPDTLLIEHVTTWTTTFICEQRTFHGSVGRVAISEAISVANKMVNFLDEFKLHVENVTRNALSKCSSAPSLVTMATTSKSIIAREFEIASFEFLNCTTRNWSIECHACKRRSLSLG